MNRLVILCCFFLSIPFITFSQSATLRGSVKDNNTGEKLVQATVLQPPTNGTVTSIDGYFELKVTPGNVTIIVSYIGMTPDTEHYIIKASEEKYVEFALKGNTNELQTVVVTENRMGEKVQKVTQSVEVMKPGTLQANNITNMENAVAMMPGVSVLDGQMSVRGGSGYAYGAGSRVTLVVDDMPLMTADRQDIKWPLVPIENVEQVELVKGASSMQYGSSALDGVLNVTTAYARDTPITQISLFYEGYGKPPVDSFQWWKRDGKFFTNPNRAGMSFLHSEKFGDFELVFSGMLMGFQSYLQSDNEYYTRFSGKLRWHPRKLNRLTIELEGSYLYDVEGFQFYWENEGHPYISAPGVSINTRFYYAYFDPKFRYIDKKGNEHKLYTRLYHQFDMDGFSQFWVFSTIYQFRHDFGRLFHLLTGVNNDHYTLEDGVLGDHKGDYGGGFVQGQLTYKFLTLNAGVREEYIHEDSIVKPTLPVFRAGANFEVKKYNYLRMSFGQAFRFPSIAEKYIDYSLGELNILPNPDLKPETGWTSEIGYKRSLKIGNWLGYIDGALFWTEFKNMMEFTFNIKYDPTPPPGSLFPYFQDQNITRARIAGWDITLYGEGHIAPNVEMVITFGYTYFYGVDLSDKTGPDNSNVGVFLKNAFTHFILPDAKDDYTWDSITAGMLKYRNPQQVKLNLDFVLFKKYHLGTQLQYYSYMTQVDPAFLLFIPGVDQFRMQTRDQGSTIWDLRAGYQFNRNIGLNFIVKNVLNDYTVIRIARPDPLRSYTVQVNLNFGGMAKHPRMEHTY